jgi:transcription termination factor Rho
MAETLVEEVNLAELEPVSGVLEIQTQGYGFLRKPEFDFNPRPGDVYIPMGMVRRFSLMEGSWIEGGAGSSPNRPDQRALRAVTKVDGVDPDSPEAKTRIHFKSLTSLDPTEKFRLADGSKDPSLRLLDLLTPIGKGQRGLIVAPPRTGKTILLQKIAHAISVNHPETHLMVVLVDERPEESTDWKRTVRGEVLSSTSDLMASSHVNIAEIAIERAKRMVEMKRDVVILMDSLTRLGRAYNTQTKNSGRTLSGGLDARTLEKPKAFFGAARNAEEGGSLTILATALIETGSRMDEVIFEEFKGTGNMELVLSRKLADQRVFPAIDFHLSGTRKEEKLLPANILKSVWTLRRVLQKVEPVEGMRILVKKLGETGTNEDFLKSFKAVDD